MERCGGFFFIDKRINICIILNMNPIVETIETAVDVVERLQQAGYQAVFAGGCVRDMLIGVVPKDIDIATSATPDQVEALFEKTVAVGKSFGVIRVQYDGEEFEVATFRKDSKESDGRRPDSVEFSSMEEDAKRRDLTINALFFDPIADKIFDFVGGQADLKARHIRFVGNPQERIDEDKLRMLRVVRFASRGGWVLGQETAAAVARNADQITQVSQERIADELTKILTQKTAHIGFEMLEKFRLWDYTVPAVHLLVGSTQDAKWHPEGDVFQHTKLMLKNAGELLVDNKVLAWGIVLHDIGKPQTWKNDSGRITNHGHAEMGAHMAREILNNLRFDGETINNVVELVENHMKFFGVKEMKQSTRMKMIASKNFPNMLELHRIDCASSNGNLESYEFIKHVQESTPATQIKPERLVNGNDLIALGLKPGVEFKRILEACADEQREGRVTDQAQALAFVKSQIIKPEA